MVLCLRVWCKVVLPDSRLHMPTVRGAGLFNRTDSDALALGHARHGRRVFTIIHVS